MSSSIHFPSGNLINPAAVPQSVAQEQFKKFVKDFPDPENRRQQLVEFMERSLGDSTANPFADFPFRILLCANWLSEEPEQADRFHFLKNIASSAKLFAGQTVMRFNGISLAQLLNEPEAARHTDFELQTGKLYSDDLHYGIRRTPRTERPLAAIDSPHLYDFTLDLQVTRGQAISNTDGTLQVISLPDDRINAYTCRTNLEADPSLYRQVHSEASTTLLFNNARASRVLYPLIRSVVEAAPGSLGEQLGNIRFPQHQPLPNLSFLDGIQLASPTQPPAHVSPKEFVANIDDLLAEISK